MFTEKRVILSVVILSALLLLIPNCRSNVAGGFTGIAASFHIAKKSPVSYAPKKWQFNRYSHLPAGFAFSKGILSFTSSHDTKVSDIAKAAILLTSHYSASSLSAAIKSTNAVSGEIVKAGRIISIPDILAERAGSSVNLKKTDIPPVKAIYLTALAAGTNRLPQSIDKITPTGINGVVFDIKDVGGNISYRSNLPLVRKHNLDKGYPIDDLSKLVLELKQRKVYTIARIACFRDHLLSKECPEMAIRSRNGGVWNATSAEVWLDPTNRKTQEYIISLINEVALSGVDEIQLDYIRFPTSGNFADAVFAYDFGKMKREDAIPSFLKKVHDELTLRNVNLSIDIFGVVAWGDIKDIESTGQRISKLAPYCEVISPMLYPSHFADNFDGFAKPGDNPFYFISKGVELVKKEAPRTMVRPWLQAFGWRISHYNEKYIIDQVNGANKSGSFGYLFWNASSNYDKVYAAFTSKSMKDSFALGK